MSELPLTGITVVSLEQAVAAPYATRQLADLGARVIKVERPGTGDFARGYDRSVQGLASYFVWINRSKESIALDLKDPEARAICAQLVAGADIFVENLAPGAATRLGLGAEELRALYPSLIICNISGYGEDGPWADRKAYDLLVQAETGLVSITGTPESPAKVGLSIADVAAGMFAYSGILAALFRRTRTGEGSVLDISLFESLTEWMAQPSYYTTYGGQSLERLGVEHATVAPYARFMTADGKSLVLAVQNEREWARFCEELLGDGALARDPRFSSNTERVANRAPLNEMISQRLAQMNVDEAIRRLDAAGIATARVNTVAQAAEHGVLIGRNRYREVATPNGTIRALVPPALPVDLTPRMDPVPALGEHTSAILHELGISSRDCAELARRGAIGLA